MFRRVDVLLLTSLGFNGSAMMKDGLAEELAWGGVWSWQDSTLVMAWQG